MQRAVVTQRETVIKTSGRLHNALAAQTAFQQLWNEDGQSLTVLAAAHLTECLIATAKQSTVAAAKQRVAQTRADVIDGHTEHCKRGALRR